MNRRMMTFVLIAALVVFSGCESDEADSTDDQAQVAEEQDVDEAPADDETEEEGAEEAELEPPAMSEPVQGIIASAQPRQEDFEALADRGVTTVVSLRESDEEGYLDGRQNAEELGMNYVQIPVDPEEGLTPGNAQRLQEALSDVDGEALVYCGTSERVGALLALRAYWHRDSEREEALELGRSAGLENLEDAVGEAMEMK